MKPQFFSVRATHCLKEVISSGDFKNFGKATAMEVIKTIVDNVGVKDAKFKYFTKGTGRESIINIFGKKYMIIEVDKATAGK